MLAVMAFHVGVLPGGWLGVELFFVLSGFLITTLLLQGARDGRLNIGRFYVRRFARLMPAAVVMVVVTVGVWLAAGLVWSGIWVASGSSLFYFANWAEVAGVAMEPYGHMWSLSIEEQFYVVWPLLLAVVAKRWRAVGVAWVAGVGFVASAVLRIVLAGSEGDWYTRVYYASDTRGAGLLAGCAAGALLFHARGTLSAHIPWPLTYAIAGGVTAALCVLPARSLLTWDLIATGLDVMVAVLLVALAGGRGRLGVVLSWRPITYVGDISYGLYLWHAPVNYAAIHLTDGPGRYVVHIVAPFLLAAASYHLMEDPIRRRLASRIGHSGD